MVVSGELAEGTHLIEADLAAQLGVSRGPLREALGVLGREGLVISKPGKGTFVRGFTGQAVRDHFAVRGVLESCAAGLAARNVDLEQSKKLQALVDEMQEAVVEEDIEDYVALDLEIHRTIWQLSGNPLLGSVLEELISPTQVFVLSNAEHYRDWSEVVALYRRLVDAVASQDAELAAETMRDHLDKAAQKAAAALDHSPSDVSLG
jgi:DNA-binding GntR family transcriptional regulator